MPFEFQRTPEGRPVLVAGMPLMWIKFAALLMRRTPLLCCKKSVKLVAPPSESFHVRRRFWPVAEFISNAASGEEVLNPARRLARIKSRLFAPKKLKAMALLELPLAVFTKLMPNPLWLDKADPPKKIARVVFDAMLGNKTTSPSPLALVDVLKMPEVQVEFDD